MRPAAICVLALLLSAAASAQVQPPQPRLISTTGESVVYVVPDEVIVTLGVETFNANLDESKKMNAAAAQKLIAAFKELKIEDRHVQTDTLRVDIHYRSSHPLEIGGYITRRTYNVTLKDIKLFEKLIDTALKNGANQIAGFEYRSTELRKHRDEARKMAIKAAKEKAAALAGELDCRIGKPRNISEGYAYSGWGWNRYGNAQAQNSFQSAPGGAEAGGDDTMPLGQMAIRASISVTFDLE